MFWAFNRNGAHFGHAAMIEDACVPSLLDACAGRRDAAAGLAGDDDAADGSLQTNALLMGEVDRAGHNETNLFLIEIATYPDKRIPSQMHDDLALGTYFTGQPI